MEDLLSRVTESLCVCLYTDVQVREDREWTGNYFPTKNTVIKCSR